MKSNKIKEKFNNREIAPAASSWDKLEQRLDATETKRKRSAWIFYAAAAIVIGIIAVSSYNYKSTDKESEIKIVASPKADQNLDNEIELTTVGNKSNPSGHTANIDATIEISLNKKEEKTNWTKKPLKNVPVPSTNNIIDHKDIDMEIAIVKSNTVDVAISNKEDTVVAINTPLKTVKEEADGLLANALNELRVNQPSIDTVRMVRADQLLRETEWDLEYERHNRLNNHLRDGLEFIKNEALTMVENYRN